MDRVYKFIIGTKRVRVICSDVGKFLSECVRRHIHIWDIRREDIVTIEFSLYSYNFEKLNDVANRLKSEMEITKDQSLKLWLSRYRHRKVFVIGFLLFVGIIVLSSSFITDITVIGNEEIPSEEIIDELGKVGFKEGMLRYGIDVKKTQKSLMLSYDKVSWIWIDIHGTKASVSVQERIPKPQIEDKTDYCNTVASSDALITELMPRYGKPVVNIGDVVRKGDVLISGISETKTGEIRYMHADGIVRGRTWYELSGEYNHTRYDRHLTGEEQKRYSVKVGNYTYPVFKKNNTTFELYEHSKDERKLIFFKKTFPISFTIDSYCEIIENGVEISDDEVIDTAVSVLGENLMKSLEDKKDLTVIDKTHTYEKLDNGNIYVKVRFECSEDIAEYKPIEPPEYSDEKEQ